MLVARQGLGDMAVSNAFGSNTFNICIALGLPWLVLVLSDDMRAYDKMRDDGIALAAAHCAYSFLCSRYDIRLANPSVVSACLPALSSFCFIFLCLSYLLISNDMHAGWRTTTS